jgi:hypothetical protein
MDLEKLREANNIAYSIQEAESYLSLLMDYKAKKDVELFLCNSSIGSTRLKGVLSTEISQIIDNEIKSCKKVLAGLKEQLESL